MKRLILLCLLCSPLLLLAQTSYQFSTHRNEVSNGYNFWLSIPDTYEEQGDKMPVVVFLHGHSLCGTDLNRVRKYGCLDAIAMGRDINALIIAPQNPGGPWDAKKINNVIDWVQDRFPMDTNRIYVIGMSQGGYGTFQYVGTYPERVAAAMALCGGSNLRNHCGLNKVPLWIIHGTGDRAVGVGESQKVVDAMKACGPTKLLRFDKFPGVSHGGLAKMFYIPETYEWLFRHSKADSVRFVDKDVKITVASLDAAYQNIDRASNKITVTGQNHVNVPDSTVSTSADTTVATAKPVTTKPETKPATKPATTHKYHIVKKGDTLSAIARKYHTTVPKLCKLNHIKETSILSLGQKIKVR